MMTEDTNVPRLLEGRRAIVTGGSRGIGRAIALDLASHGANVAIVYAGQAEAAAEVCDQAAGFGVTAKTYQCDVSDFEASKALCEQVVADLGGIDIVVNNAGITRDNLLMRMSEEDFDRVIAVNLKGVFNITHHLMRPLLRSPYGRVINITSVSALQGTQGQANYAASKAGMIGFTKTLAREVAARQITCNAIAPGLIDTDMTGAMPEGALEALKVFVPMRRTGAAEDIAHAATFLASDNASYITGQVLQVDGGLRI